MPSKKILIIEDDDDILTCLKEILEEEGYNIALARNGMVALNYLTGADALPDLILLDLMMPVMDGYEFRAVQFEDARLAGIPVVVMSAGGYNKPGVDKLHANFYMQKPFDINILLQAIEKHTH